MGDLIRVAIVDVYPLFRAGLVQAMSKSKSVVIVAEGATATEAETLAGTIGVDILLIEAAVPGSLKAANAILQERAEVKVIFLSAVDDSEHAIQAMSIGAHGYVMKGITGKELMTVIKSVHAGDRFISPDLAWRLLAVSKSSQSEPQKKPAPPPRFSDKERQILGHILRGLTTVEIASLMGLKNGTIRNYTTLVFRKLGVRNRLEAIAAFQ